MPRQLITEGRPFSLVPMRQGSDDKRTGAKITAEALESGDWGSHYYEPRVLKARTEADGIVTSQEPTFHLSWSKGTQDGSGNPGDQGHVIIEVELDEGYLERLVAQRKTAKAKGMDVQTKVFLKSGSLSWRDLNLLRKATGDARDGAFGKPE